MELNDLVIRFCGDSGDGMQLVGTMFSNLVAKLGFQVYTYPSYPADMRAPKDSLTGVSSFQVHFGEHASEPGDKVDILVCMNPASYVTNCSSLQPDGVVIYDGGTFDEKRLTAANLSAENPFEKLGANGLVWQLPVSNQCGEIGSVKSRNIYMLGALCYYLDIDEKNVETELAKKFGKKPELLELNKQVLSAAYNFCTNLVIDKRAVLVSKQGGEECNLTLLSGCQAVCRGLIKAAEVTGKRLFLGSYPITPATDILIELENQRKRGVIAIQAEDELASCSMAIGASFGGAIGVTSTSGPGLCLKSEAINLAVMGELPLVVIDVMRGGPSTGLPTKTEQGDLNLAIYGRSGDSPLPVLAALSPADCYAKAYEAVKMAVENRTPVILLLDAYVGKGLEMTDLNAKLPEIIISKEWTCPGNEPTKVLGGSEVDKSTLTISTDEQNHIENLVHRAEKVANIAVSDIKFEGQSDVLLCGWGSTQGKLEKIASTLCADGINVAVTHFDYICPLPANIAQMNNYKRVIVVEQSMGQFSLYLSAHGVKNESIAIPNCEPLNVDEIVGLIKKML